jgi:type I restriction enzyme R subunit
LRDAIARLNSAIPSELREEVLRKVLRHDAPSLVANNRAFTAGCAKGFRLSISETMEASHVGLINFNDPDANDWMAVNQFTVIEWQSNRRPDIVVFVNGLPLGINELKIPEDTDKWFAAAYNP